MNNAGQVCEIFPPFGRRSKVGKLLGPLEGGFTNDCVEQMNSITLVEIEKTR